MTADDQGQAQRQATVELDGGFPVVAFVHLLTVAGLLLGCINGGRLNALSQQDAEVLAVVGGVVALALFGGVVGLVVGLTTTHRLRGCLLGAPAGAATALVIAGILLSASPARLLVAMPVMLVIPLALRYTHR